MKFSVVIPVYQAAATLPAVLAAWQSVTPAPELILVVDDGSTDDSADCARRAGAKVTVLPRNCGRGAARAHALRETTTTLVVMGDATLIPWDDFIARAIPWFLDAKVAAVFAHTIQPDPRTFVDRWRVRHLFKPEPSPLNRQASLSTSLCVLRREAVEQAGGFDPALRCGEDIDLGRRLLAAGWEVIADPALRAMSLSRESAPAVLARYARWNSPQGIRGRAWLRQLAYAVKVMARQDLQAGDPLAALLSFASPFYQLRRR